VDGIDKMIDSF